MKISAHKENHTRPLSAPCLLLEGTLGVHRAVQWMLKLAVANKENLPSPEPAA